MFGAGTLRDTVFKDRVGLFQGGRHGVELVRQFLDLVTGSDADTVVKVPLADGARAVGQQTDRTGHPEGQPRGHRDGDQQQPDHEAHQDETHLVFLLAHDLPVIDRGDGDGTEDLLGRL